MNILQDISKIILDSKRIGIAYHVSPGGDAVGSALALLNGLRTLKKDACLISEDIISENLQFLKGANEATGNLIAPVDNTSIAVVLDYGNYERISADLDNFKGSIVNLDHHIANGKYGELDYVDIEAAATAEVVFELLELLGIDFDDKNDDVRDTGTRLYAPSVTDTGAFRHSNVASRAHNIAARLKKIGVSNTYIHRDLFNNKSFERTRLIGKALNDMELLFGRRIVLVKIPMAYGDELGIEIGDTSDMIAFGLQIKGVEVILLIKEIKNGSKASLRSEDEFDVRDIVGKLGGGDHVKAAGITLKGIKLDETKNKILEEVEKELL